MPLSPPPPTGPNSGVLLARLLEEILFTVAPTEPIVAYAEGITRELNEAPRCPIQHTEALRQRVQELEHQLGILRESDGRELRLGVTATRVEELHQLALSATDAQGEALRDAVRFYDLVRKAWQGSNEEYAELQGRVATAITWLVTVKADQPASIIADRARLALKALRDG